MRLAFGKAVGTAARVQSGQKVFSVWTTPQYAEKAKASLRRGIYKIPTPARIVEERAAEA
jgi:large subunit ribosomal protein L10e